MDEDHKLDHQLDHRFTQFVADNVEYNINTMDVKVLSMGWALWFVQS